MRSITPIAGAQIAQIAISRCIAARPRRIRAAGCSAIRATGSGSRFCNDSSDKCHVSTTPSSTLTPILSPSRLVIRLTQAGAKRLRSVFRNVGVGREHPDWRARTDICSRCPLCVVDRKRIYCGKPFLSQIDRDQATEGCGCPVIEKAKDPSEHCPRDRHFNPSTGLDPARCDCSWCTGLRGSATLSK